jgi:hypothetical protein
VGSIRRARLNLKHWELVMPDKSWRYTRDELLQALASLGLPASSIARAVQYGWLTIERPWKNCSEQHFLYRRRMP